MKKTILNILVITFLFSCIKGDKATILQYTIKNNSNHKLKIYNVGAIRKDVIILPYTEHRGQDGSRGTSIPTDDVYWVGNPYDSVKIIFNDTLTIYHGSIIYSVLRDVASVKSYKYEQLEEYVHSYEYIFTNADFDEAKTINGL